MFVDASGKRLRRARIGGLAALAGVTAYVALVGSAFLGGPDIIAPLLPEAFAPQVHSSGRQPAVTRSPLPSSPKPPSAVPDAPPADPSPVSRVAPASPVTGGTTAAASTPVPAAHGSPSSTQTPGPGSTSGRSASAPGQANRPPAPQKP
ncbi:hypothetical protein SAMN04515692_12343 [Leifsonia sp. CL147]|nr:hypothetical protein SAMN04515694_12243 [Leifsonia sp. CL154]SFM04660.1 hypothetical protein SAMN04515692_12343 [Leifsonia sp. CL147]